jgi:hypothetical protein
VAALWLDDDRREFRLEPQEVQVRADGKALELSFRGEARL